MSNGEQAGEEQLVRILKSLVDNGKLLIVGLGGHGKTTAVMHLAREIMKTKEYQEGVFKVKISDTANVWKWKFDEIPYIDVTKSRKIPENEQALLLDLGFTDTDLNMSILESIVRADYYKQKALIDSLEGRLTTRRIYIIEEMQNMFGSYSMSGKSGKFWLKEVSEGRNYGQYMIGLGQRLADISTKVVERTRYFLLGAISGDNDAKKLRQMFGSDRGREVTNNLLALSKYDFLWIDKENPESSYTLTFPKFEQNGKPYEWTAKPSDKITARRTFI